jgi:CRISPR/Cas system-associated endonuclease Cas1
VGGLEGIGSRLYFRVLRLSDFTWVGEAVYLKTEALKRFLAAYTGRLKERVWHPVWEKHLSYQQVFEGQARLLARVIRGESAGYVPFRAK